MILPVYRTFAAATRYLNPFSGSAGATSYSGLFHPPRAISVQQGTLNGNAPGAGDSFVWQFTIGYTAKTANGSAVTVADTATAARATVSATLPAATDNEDTSANYIKWTIGGTPTTTENMVAFSCEDSADAVVDYHGWGSYADNIMSGKSIATDYYTTFGIGGTTTLTATEADVKMVWPSTGSFKYCAVIYSTPGAGVATVQQRIDGADNGFLFTLPAGVSAKTMTSDVSTTVPITAGQTVDWRVNQATTATLTCSLIVGFIEG